MSTCYVYDMAVGMQKIKASFCSQEACGLWGVRMADTQLTVILDKICETRRLERLFLITEGPVEAVMLELSFEGYLEFQQKNIDFFKQRHKSTWHI